MDNYTLLERLGQGTFAVVWKARRKSDNRLVAAKQLRQTPATWDECKRLPEIRAATTVRAPHVIALLEAVRHGNELFLVFEYADSDLYRCLQTGAGRRFEESQVRWAMAQLLSGLSAVHAAGLVHCDIKPENLLIFSRGGPANTPVLKLCDLGQAASAGDVQSYVGTRWYRAPELILGTEGAGVEIDMWAAGCAMAELFLLRPAFPGTDTRDMLFRICSAIGAPGDGWSLGARFMQAAGLRFAPSAAEGPLWLELAAAEASPPAVDLARALLQYEPTFRCTAARALLFPFFAGGAEAPIAPPDAQRRGHTAERMQRSRDEAKAVERRIHGASRSVGPSGFHGTRDSADPGGGSSGSRPTAGEAVPTSVRCGDSKRPAGQSQSLGAGRRAPVLPPSAGLALPARLRAHSHKTHPPPGTTPCTPVSGTAAWAAAHSQQQKCNESPVDTMPGCRRTDGDLSGRAEACSEGGADEELAALFWSRVEHSRGGGGTTCATVTPQLPTAVPGPDVRRRRPRRPERSVEDTPVQPSGAVVASPSVELPRHRKPPCPATKEKFDPDDLLDTIGASICRPPTMGRNSP